MNNIANENIITNDNSLESCIVSGQGIEIEKTILTLLENDGEKTTNALAKKLGASVITIYEALSTLINEGKIKRIGGNRQGTWAINNSSINNASESSIRKENNKASEHNGRKKLRNEWIVVESTKSEDARSEFQGEVLDLLRNNGRENLKTLSTKLNTPRVTIYMTLESLIEEGKIKWV